MTVNTDNIFWLGHAGFRINGSRTVYIDPWDAQGPVADIILVTHDHFDHCDPPTLKGLVSPKTHLAADPDSLSKMKANGLTGQFTSLDPGDEIEILGVNIKAVPSYNLNKHYHPKSKNNLGFVVTMDGLSVYHAGDTDFIPEMKDITAQVALLPIAGTYVMTAEEAVQAALVLKPEVAIPMHYGKTAGESGLAEKFAAGLDGRVKVEIKELS